MLCAGAQTLLKDAGCNAAAITADAFVPLAGAQAPPLPPRHNAIGPDAFCTALHAAVLQPSQQHGAQCELACTRISSAVLLCRDFLDKLSLEQTKILAKVGCEAPLREVAVTAMHCIQQHQPLTCGAPL